MTKEQEKAIENLNKRLIIEKHTKNIGTPVYISDLTIALNLIKEQQAELEKKDKIIDEMAEAIYDYANLETLIKCPAEHEGKYNLENCKMSLADRNCIVCIKQYFEKKVEEK